MERPVLDRGVKEEALELLGELVRIDTSPTGEREGPAAELVAEVLGRAGLEPVILEAEPGRPNVVARLRGSGELPPLLVTGHLDTVPAGDLARWSHPPFGAEVHDGFMYGRGTVDMKGMVAMGLTVITALAREGVRSRRDLVFAAVAGEEEGCGPGSRFLVEEHPDLVEAEYAFGEVGGFTEWIGTLPVYPIQVAEKGRASLRLVFRGESGHGSIPRRDNPVVLLARAVERLGSRWLPFHPTVTVERFVTGLAEHLPPPKRWVLPRLLDPRLGPVVLERLMTDPALQRGFGAILTNTVSPTMLRAGEVPNQIPGEASCHLDGRLLPGQSPQDLIQEIREVIGDQGGLELLDSSPAVECDSDDPLFGLIAEEIQAAHPGAVVLPNLIPGFTDGRYFTKLGAKWYGFSPLRLPLEPRIRFSELFHGFDERIPVEGFFWGLDVLYRVVRRWIL